MCKTVMERKREKVTGKGIITSSEDDNALGFVTDRQPNVSHTMASFTFSSSVSNKVSPERLPLNNFATIFMADASQDGSV